MRFVKIVRQNVRRFARKKLRRYAKKNVRQNVRRFAKNVRQIVAKNVRPNVSGMFSFQGGLRLFQMVHRPVCVLTGGVLTCLVAEARCQTQTSHMYTYIYSRRCWEPIDCFNVFCLALSFTHG